MNDHTNSKRFQVIAWARGNYGVRDTSKPLGDPERIDGQGFRTRREADSYVRQLNVEAESAMNAALDGAVRAAYDLDLGGGNVAHMRPDLYETDRL